MSKMLELFDDFVQIPGNEDIASEIKNIAPFGLGEPIEEDGDRYLNFQRESVYVRHGSEVAPTYSDKISDRSPDPHSWEVARKLTSIPASQLEEKGLALLVDILNLKEECFVLCLLEEQDIMKEFVVAAFGCGVSEQLVLNAAWEYFDNASTMHSDEGGLFSSKLCLGTMPKSTRLQQELDLIEAVNQLGKYQLLAPSAIQILPIEVRLSPNRLVFVEKILEVIPNLFKQSEAILGLTSKLGYQGDLGAHLQTRSMLVEAALNQHDYDTAQELLEELKIVRKYGVNPTQFAADSGYQQRVLRSMTQTIDELQIQDAVVLAKGYGVPEIQESTLWSQLQNRISLLKDLELLRADVSLTKFVAANYEGEFNAAKLLLPIVETVKDLNVTAALIPKISQLQYLEVFPDEKIKSEQHLVAISQSTLLSTLALVLAKKLAKDQFPQEVLLNVVETLELAISTQSKSPIISELMETLSKLSFLMDLSTIHDPDGGTKLEDDTLLEFEDAYPVAISLEQVIHNMMVDGYLLVLSYSAFSTVVRHIGDQNSLRPFEVMYTQLMESLI
ncbi:hypothetical protein HDU93_003870, partial [Gonapodya sp. JEL0774]